MTLGTQPCENQKSLPYRCRTHGELGTLTEKLEGDEEDEEKSKPDGFEARNEARNETIRGSYSGLEADGTLTVPFSALWEPVVRI